VRTYDFSGGALAILARRTTAAAPAIPADPANVALTETFAARVAEYSKRLRAALERAHDAGITTAIYGAGVRACTLTNALRIGGLAYAIDDQAERAGKFLPGTRIPIRPSSALAEGTGPIVVLLAVNNENEVRVRAQIAERTTRPAHVISVCGPADIWAELERLEAAVTRSVAV